MRKLLMGIVLMVVMISFAGCITTGDKHLLDQIKFGAVEIQEKSSNVEVKAIAKDVELNAIQLTVAVGEPEVSVGKYSAELSAAARKQAAEEHETMDFFKNLTTDKVKEAVPWGGTVIFFISWLGTFIRKRTSDKKVLVGYKVLDKVKTIASTKGISQETAISVINEIAKANQSFYNIGKDCAKDINKLKQKGDLKS